LLVRFDIIELQTDIENFELDFMFNLPDICSQQVGSVPNEFEEEKLNFNDKNYEPSLIDQDPDCGDSKSDAQEADKTMESDQFPDFFEFLDGRESYKIITRLELSPNEGRDMSKHINLVETFDLNAQMGQLSVFLSDKSLLNGQPELIFYMNYKSESIFRVEGQDCSLVKELDSWLRLFSTQLTYSRVLVDGDASKTGTTVESSKLRHYGVGALWRQAARSESSGFVGLEREPFHGQDGSEYRRAVWSFREDDDNDLVFNFQFLLNLTQLQRDKESGYVGRRTVELLSLNSIYWAKPTEGADTKFRSFTLNVTSFERSESQPMILPSSCMAALEEAREREEREARVYEDVRIPSLKRQLEKSGLLGGVRC